MRLVSFFAIMRSIMNYGSIKNLIQGHSHFKDKSDTYVNIFSIVVLVVFSLMALLLVSYIFM